MWIQSLEDFIKHSLDKREVTRAMAVKMLLCGYKHKEIMPILGISSGFISTWKKAFFQNGVEGLGEIFKKKSQPYIFSAYSKSLVVGAAPGRALPRLGFFFLESALKLAHKGSKGFLDAQQHTEVIEWLQTKDKWTLNELEYQIASKYGVTFESRQSYYDLFNEARISWKKTQANNPKNDPELVASKKKNFVSCWRRDDLK
jgi:putative transposase